MTFLHLQELKSLLVAVKLQVLIFLKAVGPAGGTRKSRGLAPVQLHLHTKQKSRLGDSLPVEVHLYGVVNHQVRWADGVDLLWITTEFLHGVPHRRKVHHSWDATAAQCWDVRH